MAPRNGKEFIEGLRANPRETWVAGRRVTDVTTDPVFKRPVQSIAELYDLQVRPEHRDLMTYESESGPAGTSFMIPRAPADLVKRRQSMKIWADATFGMVGRSPDYLNTVLMTWAEGADFFGQRGPQFAQNVRDYYKLCRDSDLFLTHAIVNPQTDRSKASHQHDDAFAHLGVVEETKEGLIVRGAKMLATHGPTADELLVYPQPGIREGEER
jgi:aromatic ring hydroxylase